MDAERPVRTLEDDVGRSRGADRRDCRARGGTTAARRAAWLRREIRRHDRLYYEQARPEISDARYDALVRELRELEARVPALAAASPMQRPGGRPVPAFAPVLHKAAMLSLESVTEPDEVRAWERRVRTAPGHAPSGWVCEPKIDGVGVALVLSGLGIRRVGAHVAHRLADRFLRLDRMAHADGPPVAVVPGIGPAVAESVVEFLADAANRDVCRRLAAAGVVTAERPTAAARRPLAGKTFVLTGALRALTRDAAADWNRRRGGRVTDAVSRQTDYVVGWRCARGQAGPGARPRSACARRGPAPRTGR